MRRQLFHKNLMIQMDDAPDKSSVPDVIVNKNGVFIDTHVRYRTISDNLSKQEYKFLLTTTLTISEFDIIRKKVSENQHNCGL